jgi:hypothetical protein
MEGKLKTHKDLDAWKGSIDLVQMVYTVTKKFPRDELYGLTNQLRRAAVSIPSNIAEGAGRGSKKEFIKALRWIPPSSAGGRKVKIRRRRIMLLVWSK